MYATKQVGKRLRDDIPPKKEAVRTPPVAGTVNSGAGRDQGNMSKVGTHDAGASEDENVSAGLGGVRRWAAGTPSNPYSGNVVGVSDRKRDTRLLRAELVPKLYGADEER